MGIFSFGNVVGTAVCLKYISATNYAIMQPVVPIYASLMSSYLGYEAFSLNKVAGIVCSVTGAVLVEVMAFFNDSSSDDDGNGSRDAIIGNILLILQTLSMAALIVTQKKISSIYPPTLLTAFYYSVGSILTILCCLIGNYSSSQYRLCPSDPIFNFSILYNAFEYIFKSLFMSRMEGEGDIVWVALVYACLVATTFCYILLSWALKRVPATTVVIYYTLQPIGTVFLSLIFFGDEIRWYHGVGIFLVGLGLYITIFQFDPQEHDRSSTGEDEGENGNLEEEEMNEEDMLKKRLIHGMADGKIISSSSIQHFPEEKVSPSFSFFSSLFYLFGSYRLVTVGERRKC